MRRRILLPVSALFLVASLASATYLKAEESARPIVQVSTTTTTEATTTSTELVTTTKPKTATTKPKPKPPPVPTTAPAPFSGDFRQYVLDCIALHEGNPPYNNGIGTAKKYRGHYQFGQTDWDNVAAKYGYPELKGKDVATATVTEQDNMAWTYFQHSKYGPWPPSQGKCREHA